MAEEKKVQEISKKRAIEIVVENHYLHRRPPISYCFGLLVGDKIMGVVTYGTPASRHLQKSACQSNPDCVIELNRLWVDDEMPRNTESWFVSRSIKMLPPFIIVSYADLSFGHEGFIYRALNFFYAGWTDMERKTPRFDYIPHDEKQHTREAFRTGYKEKRRRKPKMKYWIVSGDSRQKNNLLKIATWKKLNWNSTKPQLNDNLL